MTQGITNPPIDQKIEDWIREVWRDADRITRMFLVLAPIMLMGITILLTIASRVEANQRWGASQAMWSALQADVDSRAEIPLESDLFPAMLGLEELIESEDGETVARGVLIVLLPHDTRTWEAEYESISECKFKVYYLQRSVARLISSDGCSMTLVRVGGMQYQLYGFVELPEPRPYKFSVPYEITGIEIRRMDEHE